MKTRLLSATDPLAMEHAQDVLRLHGVVAFPTDTVYGLAAGVFDAAGIDRLYAVKGREHTKAIAVLLAEPRQLDEVAGPLPAYVRRIAEAFWPGALTLVVPQNPNAPTPASQSGTIGVRIPDHPIALELLRRSGPLAVTSANLSGGENARSADDVLAQLGGRIDLILDGGRTPGGVPSTVVDCTSPQLAVLREGPITIQQLLKYAG